MEDPTEVKVWWQSKTVWAQIIAILFAVFTAVTGRDLAETIGMSQADLLVAVLSLLAIVNIFLRFATEKPVAATPARAEAQTYVLRSQMREEFAPSRASSKKKR